MAAFVFAAAIPVRTESAPNLSITGSEESVWLHHRDGCDAQHIPDAPLRAIKRSDGQIVAYSADNKNRPLIGNSILELKTSCDPSYEGAESPDPRTLDYRAWIAALWTSDGVNVHAFLHNEYRANQFPGACRFKKYVECWYNIVTYVTSRDGGRHFNRATGTKLIAAPTFPQDVDQGRHRGFFSPSNIVNAGDAFYALIYTTGGGDQLRGACLFRLQKKDAPWDWWAFDGTGFTVKFLNPYAPRVASLPCKPVGNFPNYPSSVVRYGSYFIAVFDHGGHINYKVSKDLITWTETRRLAKLPASGSTDCNDKVRYAYPTLIDSASTSINFDTIGDSAWLFLVRFNISSCKITRDRDLVRFPVSISGG